MIGLQRALSSDELRREWKWYFGVGVALVLLGILALIAEVSATLASVIVYGAIVFVAGIAQIVGAFRAHGAGHVFLYLLLGVLDAIVGLILIGHPLLGALVLTLLLAIMFVVGGAFRLISALWLRFPHYGWAAFSGAVTVVLGLMLWDQFPTSALWFIGLAIGINFIFFGASLASMGLRLRTL